MKVRRVYRVARGCTHCGTCIYECPVNAIKLTRSGAVVDEQACTGCRRCCDNCASEAIEAHETEDMTGKE